MRDSNEDNLLSDLRWHLVVYKCWHGGCYSTVEGDKRHDEPYVYLDFSKCPSCKRDDVSDILDRCRTTMSVQGDS